MKKFISILIIAKLVITALTLTGCHRQIPETPGLDRSEIPRDPEQTYRDIDPIKMDSLRAIWQRHPAH